MKFLRNQPLPGLRLTRRPIDLLEAMWVRLAFGVWRLAFGVRRLAFGVRRSAFGGWLFLELDFKPGRNVWER